MRQSSFFTKNKKNHEWKPTHTQAYYNIKYTHLGSKTRMKAPLNIMFVIEKNETLGVKSQKRQVQIHFFALKLL